MSFDTTLWGSFGQEKVTTTAKKFTLGTRMVLPDGRAFRYASAGEAIGAGTLCMQAAGVANHDMDLVVAASVAVGATTVTATLGATLATVNQYADGYLYINDGPGEGHIYRIKSHAAVASAGVITLKLAEPVAEALTVTTSLCGLMANPYTAVELWDVDDIDGPPVGVAAAEIASGSYGWLQTWGYAAVLAGAVVPVLGDPVMPADTAADDGHVEVLDIATVAPTVGLAALIAPVDTDYGVILLTIQP